MVVSDNEFIQDYNLEPLKWIDNKKSKKSGEGNSFKLENKHRCTIQVYPNGKLIVAFECTYRPFKLAKEDDSGEFIETIGKVALILSQQLCQTSIIPQQDNGY
jgi:hypothetical protein